MDLMEKNIIKMQNSLQAIRKVAGLSAEELGEKIGVTKQTISNIENKKTKLTKTQYLALSMVINTMVMTSDNPALKTCVDALLKPDPDEDEEINRIIEESSVKAIWEEKRNEAIEKLNKEMAELQKQREEIKKELDNIAKKENIKVTKEYEEKLQEYLDLEINKKESEKKSKASEDVDMPIAGAALGAGVTAGAATAMDLVGGPVGLAVTIPVVALMGALIAKEKK